MISLDQARSLIRAYVRPLVPVLRELNHVHGSVLAEEIRATEDFPGFDRAAMDGYAVALEDDSTAFKVIGEVSPGQVSMLRPGKGECVRIFTGAALPDGASQVIMQENVRREAEVIHPLDRNATTHVRRKGEDAKAGTLLMGVGRRLCAPEVSLLAHLGVIQVRVTPSPRVIHLATGNELVCPDTVPGPGQIRDSNSSLIASLLTENGAQLVGQRHCVDELSEFVSQAKSFADEDWDLLLISGGASVGDYDFGVEALKALGFEIHFHGVNLRPGKPLAFATRGRQSVFLIPGNPVSHLVVFHVAIKLAIETMEGAIPSWALASVALAEALPEREGRRETYWPAQLFSDAGQLRVRPLAWRSSGDLCGLVGANALIQRLPGAPPLQKGEAVSSLLLNRF